MVEKDILFRLSECGNCSMQSSCAAGRLVLTVLAETGDAVDGIVDFRGHEITLAVVEGSDIGDPLESLTTDLTNAADRAQRVRHGLEAGLAAAMEAQQLRTSLHIVPDDRTVEMERIAETLEDLPHPTNTLSDSADIGPRLQQAAEDALRFTRQEVCLATMPPQD